MDVKKGLIQEAKMKILKNLPGTTIYDMGLWRRCDNKYVLMHDRFCMYMEEQTKFLTVTRHEQTLDDK